MCINNNAVSPSPHSWPQQRRLENEFSSGRGIRRQQSRSHSIIDIGSSTDDDAYSFSSDDDHLLYATPDSMIIQTDKFDNNFLNEYLSDDDDDDDHREVDRGLNTSKLNSKDWEVQMLAQKLAEEQKGVARKIDLDISAGRLRSDLAELHTALATDDLETLTDIEVCRLEKHIHTERETLRKFAKLYSLDERPVLQEEFCPLYRSRSQQLVSRSQEIKQAGPKYRRLSRLLTQLVSLPLSEQFLLDRLLHSHERSNRLAKQRSLCDDQLSSYGDGRLVGLRKQQSNCTAFRRSQSMCSPPASCSSSRRNSGTGHSPVRERGPAGETGPPTVSAMLATLQRSVSTVTSSTRASGRRSSQTSQHESKPILYSSR